MTEAGWESLVGLCGNPQSQARLRENSRTTRVLIDNRKLGAKLLASQDTCELRTQVEERMQSWGINNEFIL